MSCCNVEKKLSQENMTFMNVIIVFADFLTSVWIIVNASKNSMSVWVVIPLQICLFSKAAETTGAAMSHAHNRNMSHS